MGTIVFKVLHICGLVSHYSNSIQATAEEQWQSLSPRFRLAGILNSSAGTLFERTFLVSFRLNLLHAIFLNTFGPTSPSN